MSIGNQPQELDGLLLSQETELKMTIPTGESIFKLRPEQSIMRTQLLWKTTSRTELM